MPTAKKGTELVATLARQLLLDMYCSSHGLVSNLFELAPAKTLDV